SDSSKGISCNDGNHRRELQAAIGQNEPDESRQAGARAGTVRIAANRMNLAEQIEQLLSFSSEIARRDGLSVVKALRDGLNSGEFRAAEKTTQGWKTNMWVKRGILLAFKTGVVEDRSVPGEFRFFDKDTLP